MIRSITSFLLLIAFSCSSQHKTNSTADTSAAREQELQISAQLLSIEQTQNKFRLLAIIQNETGVTSFSKGDTVSLFPNFIHRENEQLNMVAEENKKMAALQELQSGSVFKASIKIRGQGKKRHGLIMNWE